MIQSNTTSLYTEIYVEGGGNFITQSAPTNFHQFYTRKIMTANDTTDNYREVTVAERATLEKSDAEWVRPPQWLVDRWNRIGSLPDNKPYGIRYNEATGYFEANTLTDITTAQAMLILEAGTNPHDGESTYEKCPIRTNISIRHNLIDGIQYKQTFRTTNMEVACLWRPRPVLFSEVFQYASCRKIIPYIDLRSCGTINGSAWPGNLEEVELRNIMSSVSFSDCHSLSLGSIEYAVDNANNTKPIIITLHPTVFNMLTEEIVEKASEKQITLATA